MKTVDKLSQHTRNRYILLARLGVPLQYYAIKHRQGWIDFPSPSQSTRHPGDWLESADNHHLFCIRRKPLEK